MTTSAPHMSGRRGGRSTTGRNAAGRSPRRWTIPLLVVIGSLALAACSGDGDGGGALGGSLPNVTIGSGSGVVGDGSNGSDITLPTEDDGAGSAVEPDGGTGGEEATTDEGATATPAPPPETAPDPATDPAVDVESTDDGLTTEQWILIVIAAVVAIALIAVVVAAVSSRSNNRRQHQTQTQQRRDQIIGGCRWAHDQAALTVLSTSDPAMLRSTWATVERQLLELESSIAATQARADGSIDPDLTAAGRAVSAVRGALAADVAARSASETPAPEIVAQTRETVLNRNRELEAATARLSSTGV